MWHKRIWFLGILLLSLSAPSFAKSVEGYSVWKFGMTKEQVKAQKEQGPYKKVQVTGGLETKNGIFEKQKTKVSFLFKEQKLKRIQIWTYFGPSQKQAITTWSKVFSHIKNNFGTVESMLPLKNRMSQTEFSSLLSQTLKQTNLKQQIKLQMGAKNQPDGAQVFSSFFWHPQLKTYYVFLYYGQKAK